MDNYKIEPIDLLCNVVLGWGWGENSNKAWRMAHARWCVYQEDFKESPWIRFGVGITKEDALLMFESREQTYYIGA